VKVDYIQTSFAAGEWSPTLFGRTDVQFYRNACETVENLLCRPYGPVISTPGTEYIREVKTSAKRTRLIKFVFSRTDAYVIEFGESYFRFFTDGGVVLSGASPYEVAHTYSEDELFEVQFAQINDIIYLTHPDHPPRRLIRSASDSWALSEFDFLGGPFLDDNTVTGSTISVTATAGSITVTSSTNLFSVSSASTRGHVGTYWKFADTVTTATSTIAEQGYFEITAVASSTSATAIVKSTLSQTAPTYEWAEGAWSDVRGWPARVTFHESRLFFARTDYEPQKIWGSVPFVYDDFMVGAEDDDALNIQLAANEANDIKWITSTGVLAAGTYGGEFIVTGGTGDPLTPSNINAKKQTSWGSEDIIPKRIGNYVYYIQRFAKKLREFFYFWDLDSYKSVDNTVYAPHISGDGFVDMDYQQNPESMLWCVTTGGTISVLTKEIDQQVMAWSRQITDGDYESIAVIPSQSEAYDEVWVVVKRTIDGSDVRYIERFKSIEVPSRQDECWYVHSGLDFSAYDLTSSSSATISLSATGGSITVTSSAAYFSASDIGQRIRAIDADGVTVGEMKIGSYASTTIVTGTVKTNFDATSYTGGLWGLSVSTISGLSHLEAETVVVLADGGLDKPNKTVSGGSITLAYDYFVVIAGLPYTQTLKLLPIEVGSGRGTSQGKIQRINQISVKVNRSHTGFSIGGSTDMLDQVQFRDPATLMGTPETLYTGIISNINFRDDYRYGSQIIIENSDPLPIEILSVMPTVNTNDK